MNPSMAQIDLPEATARRILNHPHAQYYLPQLFGNWFRNAKTGEVRFQASCSEATLQHFLEGVALIEESEKEKANR